MQQYLQVHPDYLVQHLGGGHGRWVIPKLKLGAEHVTDFVVGERSSIGYEWQAIELESPSRPLCTKSGNPSHFLTHAIQQILDWRIWLTTNQNYAARSKAEGGLGLAHITNDVEGLILIGRRSQALEGFAARRRRLSKEHNIQIHTFDYLVDSLQGRIDALAGYRRASTFSP